MVTQTHFSLTVGSWRIKKSILMNASRCSICSSYISCATANTWVHVHIIVTVCIDLSIRAWIIGEEATKPSAGGSSTVRLESVRSKIWPIFALVSAVSVPSVHCRVSAFSPGISLSFFQPAGGVNWIVVPPLTLAVLFAQSNTSFNCRDWGLIID